jgi:hypothetical protein
MRMELNLRKELPTIHNLHAFKKDMNSLFDIKKLYAQEEEAMEAVIEENDDGSDCEDEKYEEIVAADEDVDSEPEHSDQDNEDSSEDEDKEKESNPIVKNNKIAKKPTASSEQTANVVGVYVNAHEKIKLILENIVERLDLINSGVRTLKIKFCGDGTIVGRRRKLINFNFTCLNELERAKGPFGNYSLGIFEITNENYSTLEKFIPMMFSSINEMKKLTINNVEFDIIHFFSGDLKFISIIKGIKSASSLYPCPWCTTHKKYFADNFECSIKDVNLKARSLKEGDEKSNKKELGYANKPILNFIESFHYVVDMLHLFLRITDVLENQLRIRIDKKDSSTSKHLKDHPTLAKYVRFLHDAKIYKAYYQDKNGKHCIRSFSGEEKVRLFEKINIIELFPELEDYKAIHRVWKDFYKIFRDIKDQNYPLENRVQKIKSMTDEWLKLYLKVFNDSNVTVYMHIFASHLYEFVLLYDDVNMFTMQGLEKLNDITTKQFFCSTNKRADYLVQLMEQRNRVEIFYS